MKLRTIFLAGLLALSLCACSTSGNGSTTGTEATPMTTDTGYEADRNGTVEDTGTTDSENMISEDVSDIGNGAANVVEDAGHAVTDAADDVIQGADNVVKDTANTARRAMDNTAARR